MICGSNFLSQEDEANVDGIIKRFVNETEKVFTVWLKSGKPAVDPNALVQFMTPTSAVTPRSPQTRYQGNPAEWGMNRETSGQLNRQQPDTTTTSFTGHSKLSAGTVLLKSQLRSGVISYNPLDLEIKYQGFKVPEYINETLLQKYCNILEAGVKIVKDSYGKLRYTVKLRSNEDPKEEGIEIADNETLMLNTLVRYLKVSFEKQHVKFIRQGWKIPGYITGSIQMNYEAIPKVELFVVSDEQGNLRYKVFIAICNRALGSVNKAYRIATSYTQT